MHRKSRPNCWERNSGSSMLQKLSWCPGKRDPSSAPLTCFWVLHRREAGRALALSGGAQRVILMLRNGHFAPLPPREAGAQVPNRCTVWPWHCGDCCCPPTLGTRNQQVHQLLPHQPHCRETNEPQGKCGFSPLKKTFPAATSLEPVLLSQLSRPSAGATQWNSFDFVHPRSRRVFLKWHCSRLQ